MISSGGDKVIMLWNIRDISPLEIVDIDSYLDSYLFMKLIQTKESPTEKYTKLTVGKLKLNIVHFYSYLGYTDLVLEALRAGAEIRIDDDGNSPLFYALARGCQGCVDSILKYIAEIQDSGLERFLNYTNALRNDFEKILDNRSAFLPDFLEAIFYSVRDITDFAIPKFNLPKLLYSDKKMINPYDFVYHPHEVDGIQEIPLRFKTLPFPISYIKGSSGSIDILDSITNCPNTKILQTDFVKTFIRNKWNELWKFIFFLTVLNWTNLALMIILILAQAPIAESFTNANGDDDVKYVYYDLSDNYIPVTFAFIGVNIIMAFYEIYQAFATKIDYFTDYVNLIDIARLGLCFTWSVSGYFYGQEDLYILTWAMVIFNCFRGLSGFRAFDTTRFYTRLIFRAFNDAISFILIFFYSTFSFGLIYYSSIKLHDASLFNL